MSDLGLPRHDDEISDLTRRLRLAMDALFGALKEAEGDGDRALAIARDHRRLVAICAAVAAMPTAEHNGEFVGQNSYWIATAIGRQGQH